MSSPYNNGGYQYGQPQYSQPQYGQPQYTQPQYGQMEPLNPAPHGVRQKSKVLAAVLFFFLGWLGVGNFYLGQTKRGLFALGLSIISIICALTLVFIPLSWTIDIALFIWMIAQIIFVLTGSAGYDRDGDGVPLR